MQKAIAMTRIFFLILTVLATFGSPINGQFMKPVRWDVSTQMTDDNHGVVTMKAMIDNGWHMYSHDLDPNAGPTPLQVKWDKLEGVELNGGLTSDKKAHVQFDAMFNAELSWWTESVVISQAFTATAPNFVIDGTIRYSACNDENCIPSVQRDILINRNGKNC